MSEPKRTTGGAVLLDGNVLRDKIIADVRARGDAALVELSNRFDRLSVSGMDELTLTPERLRQAFDGLPEAQREALRVAAAIEAAQ